MNWRLVARRIEGQECLQAWAMPLNLSSSLTFFSFFIPYRCLRLVDSSST